jgi:phosphonoacetaldehyde hydrolase
MKLLHSRVPALLTPFAGLRAIILDWAGTTVDFGSLAPVRTLQEVFTSFDTPVSEAQARRDMGLPKRDHIARILAIPEVRTAWRKQHGSAPGEPDIDAVYTRFIPLQFACLSRYSSMIPGVVSAVERARARGLKIGSTTGYTRPMLDLLLEQSSAANYLPDCSLSPEDVGSGRPHPHMIFEAANRLRVYPLAAVVKIGDTPADIHEGLNAGVWSVGVARTGNMVGLSEADFNALPAHEQEYRLAEAWHGLRSAGAHFVIDSVAELDQVLDEIERLLRGSDAGLA